ncbi:MAG: hypothetical protein JW753_11460 [Dehalococcoidia bacterium]|nr:hypothetical protein [Dehalococcoidia bacterium]
MDQKSFEEIRAENEAQMARIRENLFASRAYPDPHWYCNACLHITPRDWDGYALGYKTAGDILVQHVIDTRRDQDILVYPIGFLYRQYLELRVKELIFIGSRLLDKRTDVPTHHRLVDLWPEARRITEEVFWDSSSNTRLDEIEARMNELSRLDPHSDAFRYPEDKHGSPTLREARQINLKQLRDVIQGVSLVLDGSRLGMWEALDAKQSVMADYAEYRDEMRAEMMAEYAEYRDEMQADMMAKYRADVREHYQDP